MRVIQQKWESARVRTCRIATDTNGSAAAPKVRPDFESPQAPSSSKERAPSSAKKRGSLLELD
jgi:hypothetical protein